MCSLPHWVALWRNHGDYTPFAVSPAVSAIVFDETHAYAPPARRFLATGRVAAEVDNFERRESKAAVPVLPPLLLGSMGRLLGGLERAFIAADCIFPTLLFLLLFALTAPAVANIYLRLLVAWASLIISFGLLNSVWLGDDALVAPLEATRTPQPEISFFILLGAAALFAIALHARWQWVIAAGFASAAVVYSYYFYAVALAVALVSAVILGIAWRNRLLWQRALGVLATMAILSFPYGLITFTAQAGQTDLLARMGAFTHRASLPELVLSIIFAIAFWRFGRRVNQPIYFVLLLLAFGALCGMNIQLITGYETQPWHFWKRLAVPVLFFVIATALAHFAEKWLRSSKLLVQVLIVVLVSEAAARLCIAAIRTAPFQLASNPEIALLAWTRDHLPRNQVIGTADPELILLIPALTADYTYVPSGLRSLTSTREILSRYDEMACLIGMTPDQVATAAAVPSHLAHSTEVLHTLGLSYTGDRDVYRGFVDQYRRFQCRAPQYHLDFVITSSDLEEEAVRKRFPLARGVYRNSRYRLVGLQPNRPNG